MNKPRALYIHIPFCSYICSYCDFPKLQYFSSFINPYLSSLKNEIEQYQIGELDTIYVGGGTPTSLSLEELDELLQIIKPYTQNIKEYTFEANPDSLTVDKLKLLYSYNVNRLSIGVESTDDKILKNINRHHSFSDVKEVIKNAREIGFKNINVDLILGLPNCSFSLLKKDIDNVLSINVEHISCYSLTVHEHTKFYLDHIEEKDDDLMREYYDYVHVKLLEKGYEHYEVSNFAKNGYQSLHNLTYWKNEQYYGVGLGASGYIGNVRYTNTRSINLYNKAQYISESETLTKDDECYYQIMLNLRSSSGLSLQEFKEKYNFNLYERR